MRWSLREKDFSQTVQEYGFMPKCERRWRESSSLREKRHLQSAQSQTYGFSPVCRLKCAFKWLPFKYVLWHPACGQIKMRSSPARSVSAVCSPAALVAALIAPIANA